MTVFLIVIFILLLLIAMSPFFLPILIVYLIGRHLYRNPDKVELIKNSIKNIFNRKQCDICKERIILNNTIDLKKGNICNDCLAFLSPWFSNYSNTSIEEIRKHLHYRKQNKEQVKRFKKKETLGLVSNKFNNVVLIDDDLKTFLIHPDYDGTISMDNPDIISFRDVDYCKMEIIEGEDYTVEVTEEDLDDARRVLYEGLYTEDSLPYYESIIESTKFHIKKNGETIVNPYYGKTSYSRRKTYYDFYINIKLNHNYLNEIRFKLNAVKVYANDHKYKEYLDEGHKICQVLSKA